LPAGFGLAGASDGTAPWPDAGQQYSWATHAADLAALIRRLHAGPLHLVGLSSGGRLAALVALAHPDRVRSLTLAEPQAMAELLADRPEARAVLEAWSTAFAPIRTAARAGEAGQAAKLFFELAYNHGPGTFDTQPEAIRQMILDDALTRKTYAGPVEVGEDLMTIEVGDTVAVRRFTPPAR
jgi:pimeloyl-ACP methyl ester carboxylesterase